MPSSNLKRLLAAGGVAAALGVAAIGVASAQQGPTPTPTRATGTPPARATARAEIQQQQDKFLASLASKLGVSVDKLKQAIADARQETGLPDRGRGGPFGGHPPFGGPRPGVRGFPGMGVELDAAAKAIGITVDQLRQELPGKSLADVAKAHNVDPAKVADALKAAATARIDEAQKNGRITAEQATQLKQRTSQMVDALITRQMPQPGQRPAPPAPGSGPRGQRGQPGTTGAQA